MRFQSPRSARWLKIAIAPYFVLGTSLVLTLLTTVYVWYTVEAKDKLQFENQVQSAQKTIESSIESYISALRAGAALFSTETDITRQKFHSFARRFNASKDVKGMLGIGYSVVIKPEDKDKVTADMKSQGITGFRIKPDGNRNEYHAILYLEPNDKRNQAVIGYDMYTEPIRRAAMEQARVTGEPVASGKVTLVQGVADQGMQAGFLIFVPVYKRDIFPKNPSERRANLAGFVYSPFRADDLLNGILGTDAHKSVDIEVYDGDKPSPETRLHASESDDQQRSSQLVTTRPIKVAGRPWTIVFHSRPQFESGSGRFLVPISLIGGLVVSFTLFGFTRSQEHARATAELTAANLMESRRALEENEARLRRLVDANIIGVMIADGTGKVIEANDEFLGILGYDHEALDAGEISWDRLSPVEFREADRAAMEEVKRVGSYPAYEKEFVRKDGTRIPVVLGAAYLGGAQESVVGFLLDLTDRRMAEEAIREADQRALHDYETLLERITSLAQALGNARDLLAVYRMLRDFAVASVPCEGVFVSLYESETRTLGPVYTWSDGEEMDVTSSAPRQLSGDGPSAEAVRTRQVIVSNDYLKAQGTESGPRIGEQDGTHPESAMVAPLAVMGRIIGTFEVQSFEPDAYQNDDVVAIQMAANLAAVAIDNVNLLDRESRAREIAENSNRMKDEFLATVSHELRTPLTAILGWARMLSMGGFDDATIKHAIEIIDKNATAQARIIDDILDVSRVITGKLQLAVEKFDVTTTVEAAVASLRPGIEAKGIDLSLEIDGGDHTVKGDANRLQQIAWNLLSNATKFTPDSGKIIVTLRSIGHNVVLTVSDTGKGISPSFLPFVFDRFRQADSSSTRQHGGLGLGLSIVRYLTELHGGTVSAASDGEGSGATFSVAFPRYFAAHAAVAGLPTVKSNGKALADFSDGKQLKGIRVLVVDDEPDAVDMVENVLSRGGATVSTANSVEEALSLMAASMPDVIVSDIGMPIQDGYELIRRVRASERPDGKRIPAIALTAYVKDDDRQLAISAGYQAHIAKPVDPKLLIAKVSDLTGLN